MTNFHHLLNLPQQRAKHQLKLVVQTNRPYRTIRTLIQLNRKCLRYCAQQYIYTLPYRNHPYRLSAAYPSAANPPLYNLMTLRFITIIINTTYDIQYDFFPLSQKPTSHHSCVPPVSHCCTCYRNCSKRCTDTEYNSPKAI